MASISPPLPLDPLSRQRTTRRSRRVLVLLAMMCLLNLVDLYATMIHVHEIGMIEVNPVGAYLIRSGSTAGLVLFKLGCIGIAAGLIIKTRHATAGEIGAWLMLGAMVALMCYWWCYNHAMLQELVGIEMHHSQGHNTLITDAAAASP